MGQPPQDGTGYYCWFEEGDASAADGDAASGLAAVVEAAAEDSFTTAAAAGAGTVPSLLPLPLPSRPS
jgi:hypothetical protein